MISIRLMSFPFAIVDARWSRRGNRKNARDRHLPANQVIRNRVGDVTMNHRTARERFRFLTR